MKISAIYTLYIQKITKKGRTKDELNQVIQWLTGYDEQGLLDQFDQEADLAIFFGEAPQINTSADKIRGVICGVRVENITDPLMQQIRWLDKLVDELAKGKKIAQILRS